VTKQEELVREMDTAATTLSWKTGYPDAQERREAYLEWLLTPEAERSPKTKVEFAKQLGVSTETLRNYTKSPWFQREFVVRGRTLLRVERAGSILESLYTQARDPDHPRSVQAAKILLDWMSKTVDAPIVEGDIAELSDEELEEALLSVRHDRTVEA
jgi:hypothetical protein